MITITTGSYSEFVSTIQSMKRNGIILYFNGPFSAQQGATDSRYLINVFWAKMLSLDGKLTVVWNNFEAGVTPPTVGGTIPSSFLTDFPDAINCSGGPNANWPSIGGGGVTVLDDYASFKAIWEKWEIGGSVLVADVPSSSFSVWIVAADRGLSVILGISNYGNKPAAFPTDFPNAIAIPTGGVTTS